MTDDKPHRHHAHTDRHGARQPQRFDPRHAAKLNDPSRLEILPPQRLFALLQAPNGGRVVDFGTGTGLFAAELACQRPDLEIIALDEQPEMLARLEANPAARAKNIVPAGPDALPRLRSTADGVLALNVLHELGDGATGELAALLKSSGRLVVADWNGAIDRPVGPPRDHVYTPAEGRAKLERVGLEIIDSALWTYHYVLVARRP